MTALDTSRSAPPRTSRRLSGLVVCLAVLGVVALISLMVGSNRIPLDQAWSLLWNPDAGVESAIIHEQRLPRTLLALVVGAGLGVAGALMQSITRNPLADPGILGINAGASLAVVLAVVATGVASIWLYLWFAFAGAGLAAAGVYVLGSAGRASATPERLALAGVAVSAAVGSIVQAVILADQNAFNEFRFWVAGSLEYRGFSIMWAVLPFVVLGVVIAAILAPSLNALALGDDSARALGVRVGWVRAGVMIAVTLLAGAATAAAGPIVFVGLGVPFVARALCGPDQRWVIPYCVVLAPVFLLIADVLARVVIAPQEIQVGVVAAVIGGPVFITIVRRRRIEAL